MKNLKDLLKIPLLAISLFLVLTSCIKDVDLDQVQEIRLQPKAVVELVSFKLEADLIPNVDPGVPIANEKTFPFEVITKDLKEKVVRVDLGFEYSNSLPRLFKIDVSFLDDRNRLQKNLAFEIPPGSEDSPVNQDFVQSFSGKELQVLNEATQVKIRLEMQPGPGATEGQLQLMSTATYQFEF